MKNFIRKYFNFSPELVIINFFQTFNKKFKIYTTNKFLDGVDLPDQDIQNLSLDSNSFAAIICNHVFEHVPDDIEGIKECYRIIKKGGFAFITIPGDFNKNKTINFDHIDNNGHYRHYGLDI